MLGVHPRRIMGHRFKDRVYYIICRAQSKKKKRKNVGTLVQTSKKVKDSKVKNITARLSHSSVVFLMTCHGGFCFFVLLVNVILSKEKLKT